MLNCDAFSVSQTVFNILSWSTLDSYFPNREIEAQRGQVTCPRLPK